LEIKSLRRFNIFVGGNNVGKTTILEAASLLTNTRLRTMLDSMMGSDRMTNKETALNLLDFKSHFKDWTNPSIDLPISIISEGLSSQLIEYTNEEFNSNNFSNCDDYELFYRLTFPSTASFPGINIQQPFSALPGGKFLIFRYTINEKIFDSPKIPIFFEKFVRLEHLQYLVDSSPWKNGVSAAYINCNPFNPIATNLNFSLALQQNLEFENVLMLALNNYLNEKISAIRLLNVEQGPNPILSVLLENIGWQPYRALGQGSQKLINLPSLVPSRSGGFLIVDEIENGLNIATLGTLFSVLKELCEKYDVQLFCSTHSMETIEALSSVDEKEISIYRVNADKTVDRFDYGEYKNLVNLGVDIRL
jgi:AAA15 family ATPase/GTPase